MTDVIWLFVLTQWVLGGFDTLYHHELTERLAWRPTQRRELWLHGVRNLAYAVIFLILGWSMPQGMVAQLLIGLMIAELFLTLWDFVEEDRTRHLPPSERIAHTLLTLNYGVILAMILPLLAGWSALPTDIVFVDQGIWGWLSAAAAIGVVLSGLRDILAARRARYLQPKDPAQLAQALPARKSILVTGATGLIGSRLVAALVSAGHDVTVLVRSQARAAKLPAPLRVVTSLEQVTPESRIDVIVNLAGEPISDGLWTRRKRRSILASRLRVTRSVGDLIARLATPPELLISGSAIGWYGLRGDDLLDESAIGVGCFSGAVCHRWERAARKAAEKAAPRDVRLVLLRTGLVMAAEGGMLARMLPACELFLGGSFGHGRQWMSWIHRDDLVRLIVHAMANRAISGPLNATAPHPVTNAEFNAMLAAALRRPSFLRIPGIVLRIGLGAFAEELLLGGQRILPRAALETGFRFRFVTLADAFADIVPGAGSREGHGKLLPRDGGLGGDYRTAGLP